jgi:DNA-binding LacI/PurR family transcriptional regulator
MRATVRDVARRARVSPKTVSNVVNGTFPVRPTTRDRVEVAMHELGYVPNLTARGLRNGRSAVIVVALPDLSSSYCASVLHEFVRAAGRRGLTIQVEESAGVEREAELLSRARTQLIDGVILSSVQWQKSEARIDSSLPPVVMIGETEQPTVDHLWVDNVAAVRELTQLLIEQGHRRIALLGGLAISSYDLRARGYREAMTAAELPVDAELQIPVGAWTTTAGSAAIRSHLDRYEVPEAIVCCTDNLAIGALRALHTAGRRVPLDVAVVGYDDIPEAQFVRPPLTTVRVDRQQLAERALDLLLRRIAHPDAPRVSSQLEHQLVRRASTGGPRRKNVRPKSLSETSTTM